jgi:hypothetical protein
MRDRRPGAATPHGQAAMLRRQLRRLRAEQRGEVAPVPCAQPGCDDPGTATSPEGDELLCAVHAAACDPRCADPYEGARRLGGYLDDWREGHELP